MPIYDLEPPARAVQALLAQVSDDQMSAPTPCESMNVQHLLFHLLGLSAAFRDAARNDLGPGTSTPPEQMEPELPDDWRAQLPARLDELAEAWNTTDASEGETQAGGVTLPGAVAGHVALNELVVHGWDLARSTGQTLGIDEGSAQASYDLLWPPEDQAERDGMFGPVVEVHTDAPLLDRVIGLSGRDPSWSAPAS